MTDTDAQKFQRYLDAAPDRLAELVVMVVDTATAIHHGAAGNGLKISPDAALQAACALVLENELMKDE